MINRNASQIYLNLTLILFPLPLTCSIPLIIIVYPTLFIIINVFVKVSWTLPYRDYLLTFEESPILILITKSQIKNKPRGKFNNVKIVEIYITE